MEGGIFSSTFELYRKGFKPFALAATCYYILSPFGTKSEFEAKYYG